jgi:hypothetical protein
MREMKYVANVETGKFLLIPDVGMKHSDCPGNWTSAGFVTFNSRQKDEYGNAQVIPRCYGKSVSLGLVSRAEDSIIIFRGIRDEY